MSNISMDELCDQYDDVNDPEKNHLASTANDKALSTERRRKIEDKLEMLRIKRELGLEDDFTF